MGLAPQSNSSKYLMLIPHRQLGNYYMLKLTICVMSQEIRNILWMFTYFFQLVEDAEDLRSEGVTLKRMSGVRISKVLLAFLQISCRFCEMEFKMLLTWVEFLPFGSFVTLCQNLCKCELSVVVCGKLLGT